MKDAHQALGINTPMQRSGSHEKSECRKQGCTEGRSGHQVPLVWIHSSKSCAAAARKARTPGRSLVHMPMPSSLNRLRCPAGSRAVSARSRASSA